MAKGQKRSNRELKKPKTKKLPIIVATAVPSAKSVPSASGVPKKLG